MEQIFLMLRHQLNGILDLKPTPPKMQSLITGIILGGLIFLTTQAIAFITRSFYAPLLRIMNERPMAFLQPDFVRQQRPLANLLIVNPLLDRSALKSQKITENTSMRRALRQNKERAPHKKLMRVFG
jgi:hypothetical protein